VNSPRASACGGPAPETTRPQTPPGADNKVRTGAATPGRPRTRLAACAGLSGRSPRPADGFVARACGGGAENDAAGCPLTRTAGRQGFVATPPAEKFKKGDAHWGILSNIGKDSLELGRNKEILVLPRMGIQAKATGRPPRRRSQSASSKSGRTDPGHHTEVQPGHRRAASRPGTGPNPRPRTRGNRASRACACTQPVTPRPCLARPETPPQSPAGEPGEAPPQPRRRRPARTSPPTPPPNPGRETPTLHAGETAAVVEPWKRPRPSRSWPRGPSQAPGPWRRPHRDPRDALRCARPLPPPLRAHAEEARADKKKKRPAPGQRPPGGPSFPCPAQALRPPPAPAGRLPRPGAPHGRA
jgi:hypothetical protein